jgi:N-acylneuraminate cytidylyltransferase
MPHERCLEIDDPVDFEVAEVLLTARERQRRLAQLPKRPGAVVLDFDGVLTDNRVIVFDDGREAVLCNRGDGMGLRQLKELGIPCLVLSSEENPVVTARCRKLGLACVQGVQDKQPTLQAWLQENRLVPANVVYVGNDVNDLACLQTVGCGVAPADAHREALRAAKLVLESCGGSGAVRELCDLIVERRKSA